MTAPLFCLPPAILALESGELKVFSGYGEPLQAEINLSDPYLPINAEQIQVRIPEQAAFERENLTRNDFLDQIQLSKIKEGDTLLVRLSSSKPLRVPTAKLLLEIDVDGKKTLRQYDLAPLAVVADTVYAQAETTLTNFAEKLPEYVAFGEDRPVRGTRRSDFFREERFLATGVPPEVSFFSEQPVLVKRSVRKAIAAQSKARVEPATSKAPTQLIAYKTNLDVRHYRQASAQKNRHVVKKPAVSAKPKATAPAKRVPKKASAPTKPVRNKALNSVKPATAATKAPVAQYYSVKPGDSTFKIASQEKFAGVTTEQMILALHQKNPEALAIENLDKLSIGQRLKLPTRHEALAVSHAQGKHFKRSYFAYKNSTTTQQPPVKAKGRTLRAKNKPVVSGTGVSASQARAAVKTVKKNAAANLTTSVQAGERLNSMAERLRNIQRLLNTEREQYDVLKSTMKEKNRLIFRKDAIIQNLQQENDQLSLAKLVTDADEPVPNYKLPPADVANALLAPDSGITEQATPAAQQQTKPVIKQQSAPVKPEAASVERDQVSNTTVDKHYTVKAGDSLFKIAERAKFSGVTVEQVILALHNKNPAALPVEKLDHLYVGQRFVLPTKPEVLALSVAQGKAFMRLYFQHRAALAQQQKVLPG